MFGERLKQLRLERNESQAKVAKAINCSQSMIARWEKSECEPTETAIVNTAKYFDVSSDYLLGLSDY